MQSPQADCWPIASPTFKSHLLLPRSQSNVLTPMGDQLLDSKWLGIKKITFARLSTLLKIFFCCCCNNDVNYWTNKLGAGSYQHNTKTRQQTTANTHIVCISRNYCCQDKSALCSTRQFFQTVQYSSQFIMFSKQLFITAYLSGYRRGLFNWLCIVLDFLWHLKQSHTLTLPYCQHGIGIEHN